MEEKKFLDQAGVQYLWSKVSMEDYPNNETLIAVLNAIDETKADKNEIPTLTSQLENDSDFVSEEQVKAFVESLNSDMTLRFYCIEDVTIVTNGVSKVYPANSNVEVKFLEADIWEIVPTSNHSILTLNGFPGALGTYYPWLEGVKQYSNILFDMNNVDFYSKWSQGNQGAYQVQFAQYVNCVFWSDNPYVRDVSKRTNYTLYYTSQLPLCYSSIPDNTFKAFFLAFNVNNDPNWGNKAYRDSFAKATWATQAFSYYGARTIGIFGHDDPDFNITLPPDCRGLMYASTAIENAGTFDAINVTDFGAKSGSWRDAFGFCTSLRNLYIKNLKVNLNVSWSPLEYDSISFIIAEAANENAITISVSPYTYNLLSQADFDLAASKNITIALLTTNYVEDKRLGEIAGKADKTYVDAKIADLVNSAPEALDTLGELATAFGENKEVVDALNESITNKQNKNIIVYRDSTTKKASMTAPEIMEKVRAGENVYYTANLSGGTLHPYLEGSDTAAFFYSNYIDNDRVTGTGILIGADGTITTETYQLGHLKDTVIHITSAERNRWNDTYTKTETDSLLEAKANVENIDALNQTITNKADKTSLIVLDEPIITNLTLESKEVYTLSTPIELVEKEVWHCESYCVSDGVEYHDFGLGRVLNDGNGNLSISFLNGCGVLTNTTFTNGNKLANTFTISKVLEYNKTPNYLIDQAEGALGVPSGKYSHTEGHSTTAVGSCAHAEGQTTIAMGNWSHTEGKETSALKAYSHAEGYTTIASGAASHAEGTTGQANKDSALIKTTASGVASHAEGVGTQATADAAHSEGSLTIASGYASHAEGCQNEASGYASHAEGRHTIAAGKYSHTEGYGTIANGNIQHVSGSYNIPSENDYVIIGNGTSDENRRNIHTINQIGETWFQGDVYVGSNVTGNKDEGSKKLATEEYVNEIITAAIEGAIGGAY